jgi:hypothetical protein
LILCRHFGVIDEYRNERYISPYCGFDLKPNEIVRIVKVCSAGIPYLPEPVGADDEQQRLTGF